MAKYSPSDIEAVKQMFDMRHQVSRDNDRTFNASQTRWLTHSPLREDNHPSLLVTADHCYDLATCKRWDVFNYMEEQHGMSFIDVMKTYSDKDIRYQKRAYKDRKPKKKSPFVSPFTTQDYIKKFKKDRVKALSYMESRGFTRQHFNQFRIGYAPIKHRYVFNDGEEIWSRVGRISIPYRIGTDVHAAALRCDPADLAKQVNKHGKLMLLVEKDLKQKRKTVTEKDVQCAIWGDRYKNWYGGIPTIFNGGTLLKQVGRSKYDFIRPGVVPDLIIDEGAINAMTFHINGVPAIAAKDYGISNMPLITENSSRINIPIHNDEEKVMNNGDTFLPGLRYFEKIRDELGDGKSIRVRGLNLPKQYNDANDFWVADPEGFNQWIDKQELQRMSHYCLT